MAELIGNITLAAIADLRAWCKDQPLEEVTKSSYVNGRLEKWYGLGSNLQSLSKGNARVFKADKPWQRLIDFGDRRSFRE